MDYESIRDVSTIPYIVQCNNSTSFTHFHTSIEIIYVVDGLVTFSINGENHVLHENEIAFADSYQPHSNSPNPHCTTINLVAQQEFLSDYRLNSKNLRIPGTLKDTDFNQSVKDLLQKLIEATEQKNDLLIKGYINIILGSLLSHYGERSQASSSKSREIVDIITYINDNYDSPLTLDSIANHFNYNKYYFSKLFNKYIKYPLNTYIGIIRVQKVFEKLHSQKEMSFIDAVFECGFNSLSTFYRYQKLAKTYDYNL